MDRTGEFWPLDVSPSSRTTTYRYYVRTAILAGNARDLLILRIVVGDVRDVIGNCRDSYLLSLPLRLPPRQTVMPSTAGILLRGFSVVVSVGDFFVCFPSFRLSPDSLLLAKQRVLVRAHPDSFVRPASGQCREVRGVGAILNNYRMASCH